MMGAKKKKKKPKHQKTTLLYSVSYMYVNWKLFQSGQSQSSQKYNVCTLIY